MGDSQLMKGIILPSQARPPLERDVYICRKILYFDSALHLILPIKHDSLYHQ